ncbi:MAG: PCYCGC motif-containing (lipo)protein [bacterium]
MQYPQSRRQFLGACAAAFASVALPIRALRASAPRVPRGPHPVPRPGITAAKVLTKEQLTDKPKLVSLFDSVREIPEVVDGIRCNCGCSHTDGFYSLLTCYEGKDAMAKECAVCQGQGRLAARLHKAGKSLDEIRLAVDAKFG